MNIWVIVQLMVNLVFFAGILFLLINRKQSQKDDQKFSKGLQILQNKISVLEDLSDQTDEQVRTLTQLLEAKYREVQGLLVESDQQIQKMEEIARDIGTRIESSSMTIGNQSPYEVQSMNKYVKAAQLAHAGKSIEDLVQEIDITRGEAELIVAMNKDQLTFNQATLPLWVQPDKAAAPQTSTVGMEFIKALKSGNAGNLSTSTSSAPATMPASTKVSTKVSTNVDTNVSTNASMKVSTIATTNASTNADAPAYNTIPSTFTAMASDKAKLPFADVKNRIVEKTEPKIRPFEFRRIDLG